MTETTQLFLSHSHADLMCAEQIRADLTKAGYTVWKDVQSIPPGAPSYVRAIENGIRGSAATVVVWSASAAQSEWVEREVLFTLGLQKPLFPVVIDGTPLGILLVNVQAVECAADGKGAVDALKPGLPPLTPNELSAVEALLAHDYIRERRKGIEQAAKLLEQGKYRERLMALLEELARNAHETTILQDAAKRVLENEWKKDAPPGSGTNSDSRHMIGARCKNGHVTYFDRRVICPDGGTFQRSVLRRGDKTLDDIRLKCDTCGEFMIIPVDCEGYR